MGEKRERPDIKSFALLLAVRVLDSAGVRRLFRGRLLRARRIALEAALAVPERFEHLYSLGHLRRVVRGLERRDDGVNARFERRLTFGGGADCFD